LTRRFPCSPDRVRDGLAVFTVPAARRKIPDPTLRAALASLTGTLGEPAIDYLLHQAPVAAVHFGTVISPGDPAPDGTPARSYPLSDGTWEIVFDGHYRFDPFGSFSALLFHESLHVKLAGDGNGAGAKPDVIGLPEEATAVSLESLV